MTRLPAGFRRLVAAAALGVAAAAFAADRPAAPPDPFLAQLAGSWSLVGTVLGKPVRYRATGSWVLEGGWLRLELLDLGRPASYHAEVYFGYDPKANDYVAHWLDRFGAAGARVVATGRRDGRTLVLEFPYAEGAFRDTLTLDSGGRSGSLLLESQRTDGSWATFASYALTRGG